MTYQPEAITVTRDEYTTALLKDTRTRRLIKVVLHPGSLIQDELVPLRDRDTCEPLGCGRVRQVTPGIGFAIYAIEPTEGRV